MNMRNNKFLKCMLAILVIVICVCVRSMAVEEGERADGHGNSGRNC